MAKKTFEPPKDGSNNGKSAENAKGTKKGYVSPEATEEMATPSYGSDKKQKWHNGYLDPDDNWEEAKAFVMRVAGVSEKEAIDMLNAVTAWTESWYDSIRELQQGTLPDWHDDKLVKKLSDNLEKYISRAAKWGGGTTYRGIDVGVNVNVGDKIDMLGTASWSSSEHTARSFAGDGTVFVCETQSKGVSLKFGSAHPAENEVAVSKDAKYQVERTAVVDGVRYYFVKEI